MKPHRTKALLVIAASLGYLHAQTVSRVQLTRQAAILTGTNIPTTCATGNLFIKTDEPDGSGLYLCTSPDIYSPVGPGYVAGSGITMSGNTMAVEDAVVPAYYAGAGVPTIGCTTGRDFYVDTSGGGWYFCKAAGQWQQVSNAGHTHTADAITSGTLNAALMPASAVMNGQANTYAAGQRQSVSHNGTNAGLRLVPAAGDPAGAQDGDVWYNVTTGKFRRMQNGTVVDWDQSGGGGSGGVNGGSAGQISYYAAAGSTVSGATVSGLVRGNSSSAPTAANANDISAVMSCSAAGGSGTAYSCNLSPVPPVYAAGAHYCFVADVANAGAATVNFNSLGAKSVTKVQGGIATALAANDIRAGQAVCVIYDGTQMQMQSQVGNASAGGGSGSGLTTSPHGHWCPFGNCYDYNGAGTPWGPGYVLYQQLPPMMTSTVAEIVLSTKEDSGKYFAYGLYDDSCNLVPNSGARQIGTGNFQYSGIALPSAVSLTPGKTYYIGVYAEPTAASFDIRISMSQDDAFYSVGSSGTSYHTFWTSGNGSSGATTSVPSTCSTGQTAAYFNNSLLLIFLW